MSSQRVNQTKTSAPNRPSPTQAAAKSAAPAMHPMLHLQRQVGNQTATSIIQAKLTVGEPNDVYEQEADRVAAEVVRKLHAQNQSTAQRKAQANTVSTPQIQPLVQRKGDTEGMAVPTDVEASIQQARGSGQPLPGDLRTSMEQAFGADFSGVRVHTDGESDRLNRSVQAKAFTTGQDIFLRQGNHQLGSNADQILLAHELAHVVQQNSNIVDQQSKPVESHLENPTPPIPTMKASVNVIQRAKYTSGSGMELETYDTDNLEELEVKIRELVKQQRWDQLQWLRKNLSQDIESKKINNNNNELAALDLIETALEKRQMRQLMLAAAEKRQMRQLILAAAEKRRTQNSKSTVGTQNQNSAPKSLPHIKPPESKPFGANIHTLKEYQSDTSNNSVINNKNQTQLIQQPPLQNLTLTLRLRKQIQENTSTIEVNKPMTLAETEIIKPGKQEEEVNKPMTLAETEIIKPGKQEEDPIHPLTEDTQVRFVDRDYIVNFVVSYPPNLEEFSTLDEYIEFLQGILQSVGIKPP